MRGLYDCIKEDKMSEEEIIQTLENRLKSWNNIKEDCKNSELSNVIDQIEKDNQATQGLLDLYNKQKEEIEDYKYMIEINYISKDKIRDKIKKLEKLYEKEMKPYQTEFGLNLSLLTKKEKEEIINKRNSLLIEITTLKELLKE